MYALLYGMITYGEWFHYVLTGLCVHFRVLYMLCMFCKCPFMSGTWCAQIMCMRFARRLFLVSSLHKSTSSVRVFCMVPIMCVVVVVLVVVVVEVVVVW